MTSQKMLSWKEIRPNQIWEDSQGGRVLVVASSQFEIVYERGGIVFDKDPFSFQCRYSIVGQ